jgi:hypothetical protein
MGWYFFAALLSDLQNPNRFHRQQVHEAWPGLAGHGPRNAGNAIKINDSSASLGLWFLLGASFAAIHIEAGR